MINLYWLGSNCSKVGQDTALDKSLLNILMALIIGIMIYLLESLIQNLSNQGQESKVLHLETVSYYKSI